MLMEDVEVESRHQRITQRVLLIEKAGLATRCGVVPGTPLIDGEADLLLWVPLVHGGAVLTDEVLHRERMRQRRDPLLLAETRRGSLVGPFLARDRVVVEADRTHVLMNSGDQRLGPRAVGVMAAAGDEGRTRAARRLEEGGVLPVEIGVTLGGHVAAASPGLVADREVGDFPGLGMTVAGPLGRERRGAVGGHVLEPLGHLCG